MTEFSDNSPRKFVFYGTVGVVFILFLLRLIQLQVLYGEVYGKKSEENSIRQIARDPIRGLMFDRNGTLVVDNRPSYSVTVTPSEFKIVKIQFLASILSMDTSLLREKINKGIRYNRFAPVKVKRDIDFATLSAIEENREKLPGVDYQVESKRFYPTGAKAAHLYGYTKEISDQQLVEVGSEYRPGDNIGATGLEAAYERYLRGQKGIDLITVNAFGQLLGRYNDGKNDIPVREGNDLNLTLDSKTQALAESLMTDKRGAVVAIDPANGGVIAFVSKPDYDLAQFGSVTPVEVWKELNTDESKPLFNRASLTRYPPGSTFKMVLAAAALEEGVIDPNWRVNCRGVFQFGTRPFHDLHVHGSTNVTEAIQKSCNVFFYQLMLKVGFERWTRYSQEFGFGASTGMDILEENPGLLPSSEFFDRVYGKGRWTQGYLLSLSIGQGEVGVSPIQMANYAATLANKGYYYTPHAVQKIYDRQTKQTIEIPPQVRRVELSEKTWDIIQEGMYRCVNEVGGTGQAAKVQNASACGKTGTAQTPHGKKDHAWFVGFAPKDNPKIAICVLVENAGYGGAFAAPIAGLCMEQYLYGELIREKPLRSIANLLMTNQEDQ
ncbi:MAG: penicillin-binding protein 2 [Ignavibacteriales bacterium]|nr:penicillin-binding protein 2 [Ignavibacteriales bacterium]